jgi:Domain of unknown function (DUF5615)
MFATSVCGKRRIVRFSSAPIGRPLSCSRRMRISSIVDLVRRRGQPPQVLWLRCGNTSNAHLKTILVQTLPDALELLRQGEAVVEISRAEDSEGSRTKRSTRPRPRRRSGKRAAPRSGRDR